MGLNLGASDWSMQDGQASVVFTSVLPAGNATATVSGAIGMGSTRREVPGDGGYFWAIEQEFYLPAAQLGAVVPKEGDHLTDGAGVVWYLQSDIEATGQGLAGTGLVYRVVTRRGR